MKEINLEEILLEKYHEAKQTWSLPPVDPKYKAVVISAMKEAVEQAINLAADTARTMDDPYSYCGNTGSEYPPDTIVDRESIRKVLEQLRP